MKKMKIEKQLIFADDVKKVVTMDVQEGLTYKHEDDGIRAVGPLYISGTYEGNDGIENFQETLEMDVLAPTEKLNGEDFRLEVAKYDANVSDEGILLLITINIHGIKENETKKTKQSVESETIVVPPIQPRHVDSVMKYESERVEKVAKSIPVVATEEKEDEIKEVSAVDDFNDLFVDAESTYTSYRLIVAKTNDTYHDIADRYAVDEMALRDTNKNKDIFPKTLVILPFQQK